MVWIQIVGIKKNVVGQKQWGLKNLSQETFQRCFNVVFWLIQRRDGGQHQINVGTTLCISTLIWTTLGNVETMLPFSTSSFTTLVNVETTLWKWPFIKTTKQIISNKMHGIQTFNYYFVILFTLLPMLRGICWRVLARPRKFFKDRERYCIART